MNESDFFKKCIWEIRTDNPSLAVKFLNGTPRPILPSQREKDEAREEEDPTLHPVSGHFMPYSPVIRYSS